jgi:hypothetical protein
VTPGELGVPTLSTFGEPALGLLFGVSLSDSSSQATTAILFVGLSRANLGTPKGGTLLVSPFLTTVLAVPPAGTLLLTAMPDDPALVGLPLDLQAIETDPHASKGLSFTAGLELLLGVG